MTRSLNLLSEVHSMLDWLTPCYERRELPPDVKENIARVLDRLEDIEAILSAMRRPVVRP